MKLPLVPSVPTFLLSIRRRDDAKVVYSLVCPAVSFRDARLSMPWLGSGHSKMNHVHSCCHSGPSIDFIFSCNEPSLLEPSCICPKSATFSAFV